MIDFSKITVLVGEAYAEPSGRVYHIDAISDNLLACHFNSVTALESIVVWYLLDDFKRFIAEGKLIPAV